MNYPAQIRKLFIPFQPSASRFKGKVSYEEYPCGVELQNIVYCFWQLKSEQDLDEPFSYRVVSDGCIDIFFNGDRPSESFLMGLSTNYVKFDLGTTFNYIGVRFFPAAFPELYNIDAASLTNNSWPLSDIVPELAHFIASEIPASAPIEYVKNALENYFNGVNANSSPDVDHRFYEAFTKLLKSKGCGEVADLAVGISVRQLRRLFNFYVGTSPKTFSKIVRFQHVLAAKPSRESLRRNKLFYDFGYFDQAHFIRDFKGFYGLTPSKAVD